MKSIRVACLCFALIVFGRVVVAEEYSSAREAYAVGAAFHNSGNYAKAQAPFEAAIEKSDDVQFRVDCYRALLSSYRLLEKGDKMATAVDYILTNSERTSEKSLIRRSYMSYLHQRGMAEDAAKRYEERLQKDAKDQIALEMLADLYGSLLDKPELASKYAKQLQELNPPDLKNPLDVLKQSELGRQLVKAKNYKEAAELYEKIAPADPKLAAWHWKEAAEAWMKIKETEKAHLAALESTKCEPESRNDQLTYYWSRNLADILVETGEYELAVKNYELALTKTKIAGYLKDTEAKLAAARKLLKK